MADLKRFSDLDEEETIGNNDLLILTQASSDEDKVIKGKNIVDQASDEIFNNQEIYDNISDDVMTAITNKVTPLTEEFVDERVEQKIDERVARHNMLHDCGRQEYKLDGNGIQDDMYWIPKFTCEELCPTGEFGTGTFPAFKIMDTTTHELKEIDGFWVSRYHASKNVVSDANGIPQSAESKTPWASITFDDIRTMINKKNRGGLKGYHLMNIWEWAAVALWSAKQGWDKSGSASSGWAGGTSQNADYIAETDQSGASHNQRFDGIMYMKGNIRDVLDLIKTTPNNYLRIPDYNAIELQNIDSEPDWDLIEATLPDTAGGGGNNAFAQSFMHYGKSLGDEVYLKLKRLGLATAKFVKLCGGYWITKNRENIITRGGNYSDGASAGYACTTMTDLRGATNAANSFRFCRIDA